MPQMEHQFILPQKKNINKFIIGGKKIVGYEMNFVNSIDVDNIIDLKLAKFFFK